MSFRASPQAGVVIPQIERKTVENLWGLPHQCEHWRAMTVLLLGSETTIYSPNYNDRESEK